MVLTVVMELIHAFIIHIILIIIIFFVDHKRRECQNQNYVDRKDVIHKLLYRITYWYDQSQKDQDDNDRREHHARVVEYVNVLSSIASDKEILEKEGINMNDVRKRVMN
jgi:hypothetical protein